MVRRTKAVAREALLGFIGPLPQWRGGPLANRLGLQVARVLASELRHAIARADVPADIKQVVDAVALDGFAVLPTFFSEADFAEIKDRCARLVAAGEIKNLGDRENTGIHWIQSQIRATTEDGRWLIGKIARDDRIQRVVGAALRRPIPRAPRLAYSELFCPPGSEHKGDAQHVLHADRHYHTVRAFLTLNEHTVENGAFIYAPGSQVMSLARLLHEYEYSIRQARSTHGGAVDPALTMNGRNVIHPDLRQRMGVVERSLTAAPNTLIVCDNMGFHRRGVIQPGQRRVMLWLFFHYLTERALVQRFWSAVFWLERNQRLPDVVAEPLRRSGFLY
jgi:hypothetical protein